MLVSADDVKHVGRSTWFEYGWIPNVKLFEDAASSSSVSPPSFGPIDSWIGRKASFGSVQDQSENKSSPIFFIVLH